jgi:dihydroorotate dehydrogenase
MYKLLVRPFLFLFDPEAIHHFTFRFLKFAFLVPGIQFLTVNRFRFKDPSLRRKFFGIEFENPVGLAAGFDKDSKLIDELACFGFGFIEIGTLTPKAQSGNEKPRLFRLPQDSGLINRMGFNNEGAIASVERLKERKSKVIIGGNIGKNKATPNEKALDDYAYCFEVLYPYVDYFVVNVSSPNTPGLRELQEKEPLKKLLTYIKRLSLARERPKPVLLKIAPDLSWDQLNDVVAILIETKTDGVVATNTTISRDNLLTKKETLEQIGNGGLSGKPLAESSTAVIRYLRQQLGNEYPIIGVGGIMNASDAIDKLKAGANLIQVYTGFIYEGPSIARRINKKIKQEMGRN